MADEDVTQAETTGEQDAQTETAEQSGEMAEQLKALQKQLEETKKAQSGSDKQVQELMKKLEQKEQEAAEEKKTAEQKSAERLAEIEAKLEQAEQEKFMATQRAHAQSLLSEAGLKAPSFIDRLIGGDDEETEAAVKEYIGAIDSTKLQAADEFAKKNGRKVTETDKSAGNGTLDDYTDEQIAAMTNEQFLKVMERSKKPQE